MDLDLQLAWNIFQAGLTIIGGASVLVKLIAPLTKNTWDDKLAKWITKFYSGLKKISLNQEEDGKVIVTVGSKKPKSK